MRKQHMSDAKQITSPGNRLKSDVVRRIALASLFLLLVSIVSACSANASTDKASSTSANSTPKPTASQSTPVSQPTVATSATTYPVKVYFSRSPQSNTDLNAVFPLDRLSPTNNIGTFAMQQLIIGPTAAESADGYFSEIKNHLTGPSTCPSSAPGPDFTLSLNTKGSTSEPGTATLEFCRLFTSSGVGTDARAAAEINTTLKQFAMIKKVVILTQDAHCFGDESGADMCLH